MNKQKIWFVAVPVILFTLLAICVQAKIAAPFEVWTYGEAVEAMSPIVTSVMKAITHVGDSIVVIIFCLALFIVPKFKKTIALPVAIAVFSSAILNIVLKHVFARTRPDILRLINETGYSFPSGHAMINGSLYVMLILLSCRYFKSISIKVVLSIIWAVLTVLIGYSRIYLGVHYAGDVLGGWLFGFAISMLVYLLWDDRQSTKNIKLNLFAKEGN